jgi:hypothetical protein
MFTKLSAIKTPETPNVQCLCFDSVTSHGINESMEATEVPKPNKTSNEGSAQQSNVLIDVKREK